MGALGKPCFAIVFLMMLAMSVSIALPAEDVLDSVYDEMETLTFESTPAFSSSVDGTSQRASQKQAPRPKYCPVSESRFRGGCAENLVTSLHPSFASVTLFDNCLRC